MCMPKTNSHTALGSCNYWLKNQRQPPVNNFYEKTLCKTENNSVVDPSGCHCGEVA
jgi:hypothetical protein